MAPFFLYCKHFSNNKEANSLKITENDTKTLKPPKTGLPQSKNVRFFANLSRKFFEQLRFQPFLLFFVMQFV